MGFDAAQRSVFLNQVDASERDVELGVASEFEQHEFAVGAFDGDLAQAFELADAVIDVDHVVAGFEIAEIAEEAGGFGARTSALRRGGKRFEKIGVAVEDDFGVDESDAFGERRFGEHDTSAGRAAFFLGQAGDGGVGFEFAHAIGQFKFVADVGEAFEFAGAGGGNHDLIAGGDAGAGFGDEGRDIAVIARGGLSLQNSQFGWRVYRGLAGSGRPRWGIFEGEVLE